MKGVNQLFVFCSKQKRKDYQKAKEKIYEKRMVLIEGWDPNEEENFHLSMRFFLFSMCDTSRR